VFGRIVDELLRLLRVPPDDVRPRDDETGREPGPAQLASSPAPRRPPAAWPAGTIPDVLGVGLRESIAAVVAAGCRPVVSGRGLVVSQEPAPGAALARDAVCTLHLEDGPQAPVPTAVAPGRTAG
jgi:hypothetical protein